MKDALGPYRGLFEQIEKKATKRGETEFLEFLRGQGLTGVRTPAGVAKMAEKVTEKKETELGMVGAKLAAKAGEEKFRTGERKGTEAEMMKRLRIGERGATERLEKQLTAMKERMEWEFAMKKDLMKSQARRQRRAGWRTAGISAVAGGLLSTALPGVGFGAGMLMGGPGTAGLFGQKMGYGMQEQGMMNLMKQFLAMQDKGGGIGRSSDIWE